MIDETAEEIRQLQTHSSSEVAVKATRALESLLDREYATIEEFQTTFEQNAKVLRRANPSHAALQNAVRSVTDQVLAADVDDLDAARAHAQTVIDEVVDDVESGTREAAAHASEFLDDGSTLLTHDYSTTLLETLEQATADGKHFDLYVTEARPRFIGRKAARTFSTLDGVSVTLITDSAGGHFLQACDRVVVGMDCIVDGVLYNRVGTFSLAAAAAQRDVPVTVLGAASKIIEDGFVFENEHRPTSEVLAEPADGFDVANPAYDATPISLLETIVTDDGIERV